MDGDFPEPIGKIECRKIYRCTYDIEFHIPTRNIICNYFDLFLDSGLLCMDRLWERVVIFLSFDT